MRILVPAVLLAALALVAPTDIAPAWAQDAKALAAQYCEGCHGEGGRGVSSFFPRLAGQQKAYMVARLKGMADFSKIDAHVQYFMGRTAFKLTPADVQALAAYYAAAPAEHGAAEDPALVKRGDALYHDGIASRSVVACAMCHGPDAAGSGKTPRLAGQYDSYLERQIGIIKVGLARDKVAHANVSGLEAEDVQALAAYLASR